MKIKYKALLLSLIFIAPILGHASDKNNAYAIKGAGIASCGKFLESAKKQDKHYLIYGGWVEGFLTASNLHQEETFDLAPWQSTQLILKIIESVCKNNRKMQFHQVLKQISAELFKQRLSLGGNFIAIDGNRKYIYQEEIVLRMKKLLKKKGFFSGELNVKYNDELKKSVVAFQENIKQKTTGLPDQGTLFELFKP